MWHLVIRMIFLPLTCHRKVGATLVQLRLIEFTSQRTKTSTFIYCTDISSADKVSRV